MAANDLKDQRDAVVKELSQLVGVHVHVRDDEQSTILYTTMLLFKRVIIDCFPTVKMPVTNP